MGLGARAAFVASPCRLSSTSRIPNHAFTSFRSKFTRKTPIPCQSSLRPSRRVNPHACHPSSSNPDVPDENNNKTSPVNGVSRTIVGKAIVEILSLIVGALLLLVVVIWRASQVVSATAWRALVWISNLRLLGKWAVARAAQKQIPATRALRNAIAKLFGRTQNEDNEKEVGGPMTVEDAVEETVSEVPSVAFVEEETRRRLILVRHAKTLWEREKEVLDHDRILSGRGEEEAKVVGKALMSRGWVPHKVLCSDSVRTMQTLKLLNVPDRDGSDEAYCTDSLYYAVTGEEMAIAVDDAMGTSGFLDHTTLMVVCHNPGCEELVEQLTGNRPEMGTGCAALLEFDGEETQESDVFRLTPREQEWRLVDVLRPTVLAANYGGKFD